MILEDIRSELFQMQDLKYRAFQSKLTPTVAPEHFIGVRTPDLRKLAKQVGKWKDVDVFLKALPHDTFEENQLHAFIISEMKDYAECMDAVNVFLPYVDNWATCDQMSPKTFKKHRQELLAAIRQWIASDHLYTARFGIKMLMEHFLDEDFDVEYLGMVAGVRSEEYYVRMMIAWYFATALAKQYEQTLPFIEERRLDSWTHNKTIQKAIESYRISLEQKEYLRGLKVKR
ncbi:MAG: DNA alkylation repair protein [Lachnospiraceae bacterium]|nr:DNA alkylation repair protein [Lachnospiraceae bacterium]